jgi:predicted nuclease of predicted toxin-antitoxin system
LKIKVDENIGNSGLAILKQASHDVMTVRDQGLAGAADDRIFQVCTTEDRVLITLDRDFGHVPRFPPKQSAGIVILSLVGPASLDQIHARLADFLFLADTRPVRGELWIVEPGRVRVHLEKDGESSTQLPE